MTAPPSQGCERGCSRELSRVPSVESVAPRVGGRHVPAPRAFPWGWLHVPRRSWGRGAARLIFRKDWGGVEKCLPIGSPGRGLLTLRPALSSGPGSPADQLRVELNKDDAIFCQNKPPTLCGAGGHASLFKGSYRKRGLRLSPTGLHTRPAVPTAPTRLPPGWALWGLPPSHGPQAAIGGRSAGGSHVSCDCPRS